MLNPFVLDFPPEKPYFLPSNGFFDMQLNFARNGIFYISSRFSTSFHSQISNLLEKNMFVGFRGTLKF